jgi:biofilm PGA synthesis lipoprotein PgaB
MGNSVTSILRSRTLLTAVPALIAILYLLLPGWWQWSSREGGGPSETQILVAPPPENDALVNALRAIHGGSQGAPVILTYHDIMYHPEYYDVTPQAFAGQMQLLHDVGYRTLTAGQLLAWLHGTPVPPRSVALTFDDGASGVWQYAAPVLARYGFHGIAFIITGYVGTHQPYYMTWPQITDLKDSGRWNIESHTNHGHVYVVTNAHGGHGPFLTSLRYLPRLHRVETLAEYTQRVRADLGASKRMLVAHGMPTPRLFAYPFSAYEGIQPVTRILHQIVAADFGAAMLDESGGSSVTSARDVAAGDLHRVDVTDKTSLAAFFRGIRMDTPLNPAEVAPLADRHAWFSAAGRPARLVVRRGAVTLHPAPHGWLGLLFDPPRTSLWRRYVVQALLGCRGGKWGDTVTGLRVLTDDAQQVQLTVSRNNYQVRQGLDASERLLKSGPLPSAPRYEVVVNVTPQAVQVTVAGQHVARLRLRQAGRSFAAGGIELTGQLGSGVSAMPQVSHLRIGER